MGVEGFLGGGHGGLLGEVHGGLLVGGHGWVWVLVGGHRALLGGVHDGMMEEGGVREAVGDITGVCVWRCCGYGWSSYDSTL